MKYLEEPALAWLNSVLSSFVIGDRVITGKLEAYSCKKAGTDKKLAKSLDSAYQQELREYDDLSTSASSTSNLSAEELMLLNRNSPLGSLALSSTRKLLINLIITMNASFPDYDFSAARAEQFAKVGDYRVALQRINHDLQDLVDVHGPVFIEKMWEAIAATIKVDECEVYSYLSDMDSDPFSDGTLWSFNFFFFHRSAKKILYFTCMAKALTTDDEGLDDERMEDTEEDVDDTMDDYFGMSPDWEDGM